MFSRQSDSKAPAKEALTQKVSAQNITVDYQGKKLGLVRIKEKPDGKNSSDYDGFYALEASYSQKNESDKFDMAAYDKTELFFLKMFPQKESLWAEGFFEAFLGKIITEMSEVGLIPPEYRECFSPAEAVTIPNVGVALLQPYLKGARPLFKVSNEAQQKKKVISETISRRFLGVGYEQHINSLPGEIHGLAFIIMIMVLFGNYSFHSGNMLVTDTNGRHVFTIIDYGAGARNYFASKSQTDIWQSLEELGTIFGFYEHKKYLDFYKDVPGLFEEVIKQADSLCNELFNADSDKIKILEAIIEHAMIDTFNKVSKNKEGTQENNTLAANRIIKKLYEYTGFSPSTASAPFCNENDPAPEIHMANFAKEITGIMRHRLMKIVEAQPPLCNSKDTSPNRNEAAAPYHPDLDLLIEKTNMDAIYWSMSARNHEDEDEIAPPTGTPTPMS